MKKIVFSVIFAVILCFSAVITASAHWSHAPGFNEPEFDGEHHKAVCNMLAMKMDAMKDDPEYRFAVGIKYDKTVAFQYYPTIDDILSPADVLKSASDLYDAKIDMTQLMVLTPLWDNFYEDSTLTHYIYLTADQINKVLRYMDLVRSEAKEGAPYIMDLLYIGSGRYADGMFDSMFNVPASPTYWEFKGEPIQWCDFKGDAVTFYGDNMIKQYFPIEGTNAGLYSCKPYAEVQEKSILPEVSVILAAAAVFFSLIAALFSIFRIKKPPSF